MKTRFEIDSHEYKGQLNLDLTIKSGQTSQPAWLHKDDYFLELVAIEGKQCLIKIDQMALHAARPDKINAQRVQGRDESMNFPVHDWGNIRHRIMSQI